MSSKILIESITYVHLAPPHGDPRQADYFHCRVWREERRPEEIPESQAQVYRFGYHVIACACAELVAGRSIISAQLDVAFDILKLDRVNAVEVKDGTGAGVVLYNGWP